MKKGERERKRETEDREKKEGVILKDRAVCAALATRNLVQTEETLREREKKKEEEERNQVHSRKSYFRSPLWVLNWATLTKPPEPRTE